MRLVCVRTTSARCRYHFASGSCSWTTFFWIVDKPHFLPVMPAGSFARETLLTRLIERYVIERGSMHWRYALTPVTGKKHQLRVHLAALGAPIMGDRLYPELQPEAADDYARPWQLLARVLELQDPFTGKHRRFESELRLHSAVPPE